jgi:hypothetical protein
MTDRLNNGGAAKQPKRSAQEWCDIGNARLRGEIPYDKDGQYHPRHDIYWLVENGSPKLGWKPL